MDDIKRQWLESRFCTALYLTREHVWRSECIIAILALESGFGRAVPAPHNEAGDHARPVDVKRGDYTEAIEGGTGVVRRYRNFGSVEACMRSVKYLLTTSSFQGYKQARHTYSRGVLIARTHADKMLKTEMKRERTDNLRFIASRLQRDVDYAEIAFLRQFGKQYCPSNDTYGASLWSIIQTIRSELRDVIERVYE